jgi:gluconolactonase
MPISLQEKQVTQTLSPLSHAVLPADFSRRPLTESLLSTRSGHGKGEHLFQQVARPLIASHPSFDNLFKSTASVKVIARRDYPYAHEAGVYDKDRNEVWFTSNLLCNGGEKRVEISRIALDIGKVTSVNVPHVERGNGACNYNNGILFCEQGSPTSPSQLVWSDFRDPSSSTVLLNNFNGRPFNSLNDVTVVQHPSGPLIFFTDPPYGYEQGFRPTCQLPRAVYAFDPIQGHVRMVADDFQHPNGIAFSPDGQTCYITDTSHIHGSGHLDPSLPSTM